MSDIPKELPLPDTNDLPGQNATTQLVFEAARRVDRIDSDHLNIGDRLALSMCYAMLRAMAQRHGTSQ